MKSTFPLFCSLVLMICSLGLYGCGLDGKGDFHHSDCGSIGGTLTPYGACIFPEDNKGECRHTEGSSIYIEYVTSAYYNTYCHPDDRACDFEGWTMGDDNRSCHPICRVDTDCPTTDDCRTGRYCLKKSTWNPGGGGSSDPCSGCGGIFCSGTCSLCAACH